MLWYVALIHAIYHTLLKYIETQYSKVSPYNKVIRKAKSPNSDVKYFNIILMPQAVRYCYIIHNKLSMKGSTAKSLKSD